MKPYEHLARAEFLAEEAEKFRGDWDVVAALFQGAAAHALIAQALMVGSLPAPR